MQAICDVEHTKHMQQVFQLGSRLEVIAIRLEAIAIRLEAIARY